MADNLSAPENFPIRRPTETKQSNGRIWNPPRMLTLGGLSSTGKLDGLEDNHFNVQQPTSTGKAKFDGQRKGV